MKLKYIGESFGVVMEKFMTLQLKIMIITES